jgi:hypothetical protein
LIEREEGEDNYRVVAFRRFKSYCGYSNPQNPRGPLMGLKVMYGGVQDEFLDSFLSSAQGVGGAIQNRPIHHTLHSKRICRMIHKKV